MQEIRSSNPPAAITGIFDPNKSCARHHRSNVQATFLCLLVKCRKAYFNNEKSIQNYLIMTYLSSISDITTLTKSPTFEHQTRISLFFLFFQVIYFLYKQSPQICLVSLKKMATKNCLLIVDFLCLSFGHFVRMQYLSLYNNNMDNIIYMQYIFILNFIL